jgi:hypothetical protein
LVISVAKFFAAIVNVGRKSASGRLSVIPYLSKCNGFLARIAILSNQVASIKFSMDRSAPLAHTDHLRDATKMIVWLSRKRRADGDDVHHHRDASYLGDQSSGMAQWKSLTINNL